MKSPILEFIDESVRGRIEANLQDYAPFLAMLTAWKQALDAELEAAEERVMHRLINQSFTTGVWHFPAQTLVVPQDPLLRDWNSSKSLYDSLSGAAWIPCGQGWTLPSTLDSVQIEPYQNQSILVLNFTISGAHAGQPLLTSNQGQLIFVAGEEALLQSLSQAHWFIQQPRQGVMPAEAHRYEGFLEFERELAVARTAQRHLEIWLPPFYPYSRKFLHVHPAHTSATVPNFPFLDECAPRVFRLLAIIDEPTANRLRTTPLQSVFIPNALPVIQASCMQQRLADIPFSVGEQMRTTFAGVEKCFCAIAYRDWQPVRAHFEVDSSFEGTPLGSLLANRLGDTVKVYCDPEATLVKIYFNTLGAEASRPSFLESEREARFSAPYPPVGAFTHNASDATTEGLHYYLYHYFLRPTMLTEGDIYEILRHIPSVRQMFNLSATQIEVSLEDYPLSASQPWHNYLWPSVVSSAPLIERQIRSMARSGVFITPLVRLKMAPLPHLNDYPRFLIEEGARHAAAVISQFFQIGMYIVIGELA